MKLSITFVLVAVAAIGVQGCHHRKKEYPPDTFPEGNSRRKRSAVESIYTIYTTPTTTTTQAVYFYTITPRPSPPDVEPEMSNYFTTCLQRKTGRLFRSWRSVVDFVIRDMRWYSSTEEQYCPENSDRDPRSTTCWQGRLDSLLKPTSIILPKAKACVQEYIWSKRAEQQGLFRAKRQVANSGSAREACLGVTIARYDSCLRSGLVTNTNIRQYPSIKNWNAESVDKFLLDHVSNCRITSRYANGKNNYNQVCPTARSSSMTTASPCLSKMYNELVRTSSPMYSVQKSCTNSLTQDKCKNIRCYGNHDTCNKNTGLCECDSGYVRNRFGVCEPEDKCARVYCGARFEACNRKTGLCECVSGYTRDSARVCKPINSCTFVVCRDPNQVCDPATGNCICPASYKTVNGYCIRDRTDPCKHIKCGVNQRCTSYFGFTYCICKDEFDFIGGQCRDVCSNIDCGANAECVKVDGSVLCRCIDGFVRQDSQCKNPCAAVTCPATTVCVNGHCFCPEGTVFSIDGICKKTDPCAGVNCGPNMYCQGGKCVCQDGFVPSPDIRPGCVRIDPCAALSCPTNSVCVNGNCECADGFELSNGMCIRQNPCAIITCEPNMNCQDGNCVCQAGFVPSTDIRPGCVVPDRCAAVTCPTNSKCVEGNCVCADGFQWSNGMCIRIDPCDGVTCQQNERCDNGTCGCQQGFIPASSGRGCVTPPPDPCDGVTCTPNSQCVLGSCVCDPGFQRQGDLCIDLNSCTNVQCGQKQTCVNGKCECLPNFVPVPEGLECVPEQGTWREWSGWGQCSVTCGSGGQIRVRQCDGNNCVGEPLESRSCNTELCAGTWMEWGVWGECPVTCGGGDRVRRRQCDGGNCAGDAEESGKCNTNECEGNPCASVTCPATTVCLNGFCYCPEGTVWSIDGLCIKRDPCAGVICGPNMDCKAEKRGKCDCQDDFVPSPDIRPGCVKKDPCAAVTCPTNSICVNGTCECSGGFEFSNGKCIRVNPCATVRCPENMECRSSFGEPTVCVCKRGFVGNARGDGCVQQDRCAAVKCPTNSNCVEGNCVCPGGFNWSNGMCRRIDPCDGVTCQQNERCDNGTCGCQQGFIPASNGRGCVTPPPDPCDGVNCTPNSQCVLGSCVCDAGFQRQGDLCLDTNSCTNVPCGQRQTCVNGKCECLPNFVPVPEGLECVPERGTWMEWGGWRECSVTCGSGVQIRARQCDGNNCVGDPLESRSCNTELCVGTWMEWGVWDECPVTCGSGDRVRRRQCDGSNCVGDAEESVKCNTNECEGDTWAEWETWAACTVTCGGGGRVRLRRCGSNNNGNCPGSPIETERCNTQQCEDTWTEWGVWQQCSVTCGGGRQSRTRRCDGSNCVGEAVGSRDCNTDECTDILCVGITCPGELVCSLGSCACPSGSERTPQDTCIKCAAGKEYRSCAPACYDICGGTATPDDITVCFGQNCRQGVHCVCPSGQVERNSTDSTCVARDQCPDSWGSWTEWGTCSVTCGRGVQSRSRTCQGTDCQGVTSQTRQCNTGACQRSGTCQSPKVFNACPTKCPKTCVTHGLDIRCDSGCRDGNIQCVCPDGMVEKGFNNRTCVLPSQCTATGRCRPNPCRNKGTCISIGSMYTCNCLQGYSGRNCEIGCGSLCTPNGRCSNGQCICNNGFRSNGDGGCIRN